MAPRRLSWLGWLAGGVTAGAGAAWALLPPRIEQRPPDPVAIMAAVREGLRAQGTLPVLAARYVAVVEAKQGDFLFETERTLVMPGQMRYLLDLRAITARDVRWNATARRVDVVLPPLTLAGPLVDAAEVRQFGAGGLLSGLGNAAETLDATNRLAGENELVRQAHAPAPMAQARAAARRMVAAAFAGPLRASGLAVRVYARFVDEAPVP